MSVVMVVTVVNKFATTPKDHITVYVWMVLNSMMTITLVEVRLLEHCSDNIIALTIIIRIYRCG